MIRTRRRDIDNNVLGMCDNLRDNGTKFVRTAERLAQTKTALESPIIYTLGLRVERTTGKDASEKEIKPNTRAVVVHFSLHYRFIVTYTIVAAAQSYAI